MTRAGRGGFTLLEVLLALTIVAGVLTLAFGGLRVGIAAWRQGEDRIERLEHTRNLQVVIASALAGAQAYLGVAGQGEQASLQFQGGPGAVQFVTVTPPLPTSTAVAYTAVTIASQQAGLVIRQKAMPNYEPFEEVEPSLTDSSIASVRFRYLRPQDGTWTDTWDVSSDPSAPGSSVSGTSMPGTNTSGSSTSGSSRSGSSTSGSSTSGSSRSGSSTLGSSTSGSARSGSSTLGSGTSGSSRSGSSTSESSTLGSSTSGSSTSGSSTSGSSRSGSSTRANTTPSRRGSAPTLDTVAGGSIPRAVEVTLTETMRGGRTVTHPPFTVTLRASTP